MKFTRRFIFLGLFASTLGLAAEIPAAGAAPRDELLRLVPDDMSLCVLAQNLREHSRNGKSLKALLQMPAVRERLDSPDFKKLLAIQQHLFKELDITPEQFLDDLIGDAVVFSFRQGADGKAEGERGLFMFWARDKALLTRLLDRINESQKKSGELKEIVPFEYQGQACIQRVKGKNGEREFYFIRDNLLVYTPQESVLKGVVERSRAAIPDGGDKPFWATVLTRLGFDKAMIAVLVNPRGFDRDFANQEKKVQGQEKGFLKEFGRYWQAFDALGLYVEGSEHLELGLAVHLNKTALPTAAQQFFTELGKPSALWQAIPEDALFAVAARSNVEAFAVMLAGFFEDDKRAEIRQSIEKSVRPFLPDKSKLVELVKGLGPDWGFWIARPTADDKTWVPQSVFALKIHESPEGAAAEKTIRNAVQFLTTIAQFGAKDGLSVETMTDGKTEIKHLVCDAMFPKGFQPAFAVKDGYVLLAGSPTAILRFKAPPAVKDDGETPLLRMSATGWRQYLGEHKNEVAEFVGKMSGTPAKDVASRIDELLPNLKSIERFEIVVRSAENRATLTMRLKMGVAKD